MAADSSMKAPSVFCGTVELVIDGVVPSAGVCAPGGSVAPRAVTLVDDNRSGPQYALEGLLALQMHAGAPFAVEFRNVYLKPIKAENLTPPPAPAGAGRCPTGRAAGG